MRQYGPRSPVDPPTKTPRLETTRAPEHSLRRSTARVRQCRQAAWPHGGATDSDIRSWPYGKVVLVHLLGIQFQYHLLNAVAAYLGSAK